MREHIMSRKRHPNECPICERIPCKCAGGAAADEDKKSAIELMDFNPFLGPLLDSDDPRPAENKRLKERFKSYLSIGFYRDLDQPDGSQLRYYLYENRHKPIDEIKTYSSLVELEEALQTDPDRKEIFRNNPKIFIEGHGGDDRYGVGGDHPRREEYKHHLELPGIPTDPSEQIHGVHFDKIINDLREVIHPKPGELSITLEVCNSDNLYLGRSLWGHEKTFLERVSESHKDIIFSGSGPWDLSQNDSAIMTGTRAPGGVNTPITSMVGNVWKSGNTVVFHNEFIIDNYVSDYQVVVKKSKFASTETAKELKINTVNYAAKILENTKLSLDDKKRILQNISENPNILKIDDLKIIPDFSSEKPEKEAAWLALKEFADNGCESKGSVFEGHEKLLDDILSNKRLLELVMVACGKVLIATKSNDSLIDLLRSKGINVNSADEYGMTALHYAVQNFYIYRDEPLNLIKKLLDCGANVELADQKGETPYAIAMKHGSKEMVFGREKLIEFMQTEFPAAANPRAIKSLMSANLGLFRKLEDKHLIEHRHDDPKLQQAYDERFGLVLK